MGRVKKVLRIAYAFDNAVKALPDFIDEVVEDDTKEDGFRVVGKLIPFIATVSTVSLGIVALSKFVRGITFADFEVVGIGEGVPLESSAERVQIGGKPKESMLKADQVIGMRITSSRTLKYFNLGNVVAKSIKFEGQTGVETISAGSFATFSDPYYAVKAATKATIVGKPASSTFWSNDIKKTYPRLYNELVRQGRPIPSNTKSIYRVIFHYCPPLHKMKDGSYKSQDTYGYAMQFVNSGAWSSLNSELDITDKKQFVNFFKIIFKREQGTTVEDWYLERCYEAIYNGAQPPLQENLRKESNVSSTTNISISKGNNNKNDSNTNNKR